MPSGGPYSAQVQRALAGLESSNQTFTGNNTFTGTNTFSAKTLMATLGLNSLVSGTPTQALDVQTGGIAFEYAGRAPAPVATDSGTAGVVTAGAHTYYVFGITAQGYTGFTSVAFTAAGTNQVTLTWALTNALTDPNLTGIGVAMTKAGTTTPFYIVTVALAKTATTYTVNTADGSLSTVASSLASADYSSGGLFAGTPMFSITNQQAGVLGTVFGSSITPAQLASLSYFSPSGKLTYITSAGSAIQAGSVSASAVAQLRAFDAEDVTVTTRTTSLLQNPSGSGNTTAINIPLSGVLLSNTGNSGGFWDVAGAGPKVFVVGTTALTSEMGRVIGGAAGTGIWRFGSNTQGFALDPLTTADTLIVRNFANNAAGNLTAATATVTTLNATTALQANGTPGITTTITTGSLVGKTITVTNGLITSFA